MRTPSAALVALAVFAALAPAAPRAAPPITLDEALAEAGRQNQDLRLTRADLAVAQADRTAAWSGLLPRLDLSAAFGHSFTGASQLRTAVVGGQAFTVGGGPASDQESYSASLTLQQAVFDWKAFHDVQGAQASARGYERSYDEATLLVAFSVTHQFYALLGAQRSLEVLQKTAARSEELVQRADALFAAGRGTKADTYSARVNLQQDRLAVEAQRIRVEQARDALAQGLGRPDPTGLEVVAPLPLDAPGLPAGEPPSLDALLVRARERRPNLAAQRAFVEAAESSATGARAGYLPSLGLQGTYNRSGQNLLGGRPDRVDAVLDDPRRAYSATAYLVLSWNLFEGRATQARVARAEGSLERARATAEKTDETVAKEVADARASVATLTRQVALSAEGLDIARQALALATERLEAGLASQLELRDANLKVTQAELSLLQNRIDHAVAVADLARAVGGTL